MAMLSGVVQLICPTCFGRPEQHRDSSTLEKFASWTDMEQREYESWLKCSIEGVKRKLALFIVQFFSFPF